MRGLIPIVGVAVLLRCLRAVLRWDEISLAYAAYWQAWGDTFARGDLGTALTSFTGLHPPGYALLFHGVDVISGHRPLAWLLLSVALSAAAVWLVGRIAGLAAAALLAVDPFQLAYCAEVNNYPLLVFAVALCLVARRRARVRGPLWPLVLAAAFAGWAHLLGGFVGGLCLLTLGDWRRSAKGLAVLALLTAPVLFGAAGLTGQEGTYGQVGLDWERASRGIWTKSGPWLVLLVPAAWLSLRERGLGVVVFGTVGCIVGLTALKIAAAHQQPYWVALGPPLAVMLGRGLPVVAWLGALAALWGLPAEAERLDRLLDDLDRERAVDQVLLQAAPGDAIWLLAPALQPDDDKTATSAVLWRLPPWTPMPAWRGPAPASSADPAFEFADYGYGQPRVVNDRVVPSTTDLWSSQLEEVLAWHTGAGHDVWFVLYDHGPARDYPGLLARALEGHDAVPVAMGEDVGLGVDHVARVSGGP